MHEPITVLMPSTVALPVTQAACANCPGAGTEQVAATVLVPAKVALP